MSIGRSSPPTKGPSGSSSSGAVIMTTKDDDAANSVTTNDNHPSSSSKLTAAAMPLENDQLNGNNSNSKRRKRSTALLTVVVAMLLFMGYYCVSDESLPAVWLLKFNSGGGNSIAVAAASTIPEDNNEPIDNSKDESSSDDDESTNDHSINKEEITPKQQKIQSTIKKYKNANRGVEGTVVKSMNRGYPLKTYLEEDLSLFVDSSDDDDESEDDDDSEDETSLEEENDDEGELSLEDVTIKAKQQRHQLQLNSNKLEEEEEEFYDATAASKQAQQTALQTASAPNATITDIDAATEAAKAIMELMKNKKDVEQHPRQWESGEEAVVKIVLMEGSDDSGGDDDSSVENESTNNLKVIKGEEKDSDSSDDSEDSSDDDDDDDDEEEDSSDDDDDSSDDDESTETTKSKKVSSTTKTTTKASSNKSTIKKATNELPLPNLSTLTPDDAAETILNGITSNLHERMSTMFTKAKTHECRAKIAEHFALFVNGLAMEAKFPFQDWYYPSICTAIPYYENWDDLPPDVNAHDLHHRVYQPPKDSVPEGTYIENVDDLELVYVILTHDQPEATIRLIESVYVENRTKFVVHVDGKEKADETFDRLVEYAKEKNGERQLLQEGGGGGGGEYIRLVPNANRVRVNWGGFSMVNATLVAMKTLFGLDYYADHPEDEEVPGHDNPHAFSFHKMIHLASTTYPLASNTEIRDTLASYPLDANFMHILLQPNDPTPQVWNYFVECDDALHRIYRLPPLTVDKGHGIDIHTSSQWFIISREFAWYIANPPKNSLVDYLRDYMEHVVVADESFFGTVLRNTHFCSTLHNDNFLHIQFGSWENEDKSANQRDPRKCVMRNPDHCGRSPTTMTLDYLPVLELSGDLFARKFDDVAEPLLKDHIDRRREKEEERFLREEALAKEIEANKTAGVEVTEKLPLESWEFQGEGVMLVAKETVLDEIPLCLGLSRDGANRVHLLPCFKEDVPPTLSPDWYTGAVIIEEIEHYSRWDIGPCSSDGELHRNETTGELEMTPGEYTQTGPKCMLKIGDSIRKGRCLDVESDRTKPGAYLNIFPCEAKWHQLFSFGNGDVVPSGGIHVSPPKHLSSKKSTAHLCLGVQGRSSEDKEEWLRPEHDDDPDDLWPWEQDNATEYYDNGFLSLKYWDGLQLQTTPCSNEGAVVEFLYVPFIVEEYDNDEGESTDNKSDAAVEEKTDDDAEGLVVGDEL
eukprot:scaffold3619_cov97-Skeletonema_marinoi.AAC.6